MEEDDWTLSNVPWLGNLQVDHPGWVACVRPVLQVFSNRKGQAMSKIICLGQYQDLELDLPWELVAIANFIYRDLSDVSEGFEVLKCRYGNKPPRNLSSEEFDEWQNYYLKYDSEPPWNNEPQPGLICDDDP